MSTPIRTAGILGLVFAALPLGAATIVVNDSGDALHSPGCATTGTGTCTLRDAITFANSNAGTDDIHFGISGTGVHTIAIGSPLPFVTSPATVDGFTQPGSAANTNGPGLPDNSVHRIEIDGTNCVGGIAAAVLQFNLGAGGSNVRGLVINRCASRSAIAFFNTGGGNHVEGCFIGTDVAGTAVLANGAGIDMEDQGSGEANDVIGGLTPDKRNLISGNGAGVVWSNAGGTGHLVQGNFIGTDASGTLALANGDGIHASFNTSNVTIGGTTAAARNVISGNTSAGVSLANAFPAGVNGFQIQGNYIGTDRTGTVALPNGGNGVTNNQGTNTIGGSAAGAGNVIAGNNGAGIAMGNGSVVQGNRIGVDANGDPLGNKSVGIVVYGSGATIGGTAAGEGNVIAYNGASVNNGAGVLLDGGGRTNVAIRGNSIFANTSSGSLANRGLGIDLNNDGPTPNDPGDSDGGDNNTQNYPVLTSVVFAGGSTTIQGALHSAASKDYELDFFSNSTCDPSGFGEGETYLGSKTVTANASGDATFSVAFPVEAHRVTATATDPNGNTSELSLCAAAVPAALNVDPGAGATSDGNGVLEPGETVAVQPAWKNASALPLDPTGAATAPTGPAGATYTIVDASGDYGTIPAGATRGCEATPDCYSFSVSSPAARPAAHWDAGFTETLDVAEAVKSWKLHVGDSFTDVPRSYPFYKKIETVFHNAITVGCTTTTYCPLDKVPRSQMAIFLARGIAKGGANVPVSGTLNGQPYNCSPGGTSLFTDVSPTDIFCKSVHYIAVQNVTSGCATSLYCPTELVSRSQMGIFVAKAMVAPGGGAAVPQTYGPDPVTGLSYSCDAGSPNLHFTDVSTSDTFCKHVHFLWAKGVIAGCSASQYCPVLDVGRDEMAKFLSNAFRLLLYGP